MTSVVTRPPTSADPSIRYLQQRLAVLGARVRAAVKRRRAVDPDPADRFRGLYISDEEIDDLLAGGPRFSVLPPDTETAAFLGAAEASADQAEATGADLRLRRLARAFGLDAFDVELLLVALAPDLDPRFERLYAYLHDDVSRRRASTGLALQLSGATLESSERSRLGPLSPLLADGLLLIEDAERPFLTRSLRVPDRVTAHLLGDDRPDPMVEALITPCANARVGNCEFLERAAQAKIRLVYIQELPGGAGHSMAAAALVRLGIPVLPLDLTRLSGFCDVAAVAERISRESRLRGAGLIVGPIDVLAERGPESVRPFAELRSPIILIGHRSWDPLWSREVPLLCTAPTLATTERTAIWHHSLRDVLSPSLHTALCTAQFRLTPEQIFRAARAARLSAIARGRPPAIADVQAGAKAQNAAGLEQRARCIRPSVRWDDLVLPDRTAMQLRELVARTRHRDQVFESWGLGGSSAKGRGVKALFAGDSGTGKTMSAEVIACDLGFDLYVIDLSTVVDKYIGETEKNLERIFSEADGVNGVLLFDEADALFGKRSEVKDARDRYANVEVAYLLQRMESFEGLAILTTNLRSNLDEAFARRLDAIIDFPMPEKDDRRRLWDGNLLPAIPKDSDIDVGFLAAAFRISGGNIRNIVLTAAFFAASEERPMTMRDLILGTEREYRKLGNLCVESEFGPYYQLLTDLSG